MSDIDRLAQNIGGVSGKIDQATAETRNAAQEADDTSAAAEALGADAVASQLAQLKGHLDALAATLNSASTQADGIRALAVSVGKGNRVTGALTTPLPDAANSDPSAVPGPARKGSASPRGLRARRSADLVEGAEGVSDLTDYVQKITGNAASAFKDVPKPPQVTGAGTRTPGSPPIASQAGTAGADLPNGASGLAVAGVTIFAWKYVYGRWRRGFHAEEQFPEEIPHPRRLAIRGKMNPIQARAEIHTLSMTFEKGTRRCRTQ